MNTFQKIKLIPILFTTLLILTACQPESISSVLLNGVEQKQLLYVGENNTIGGTSSENISQIDVYIGDELVEQIISVEGEFELNITFDEVGLAEVKLIAFAFSDQDDVAQEVAQSNYLFDIASREVDYGDEEQPPQAHSDLDFSVSLVMHNFDSVSKQKGLVSKEMIEAIFNSEEFRQKVLLFRYDGVEQFADNKGMSNQEIYDRLMTGAEVLNGVVDVQMDIDITLYRSSWFGRNTIGYTTADSPKIYSNTRFFYDFTPADIAGNWTHEWVHKMGFGHDRRSTAKRPYSVPYAIGYIVRDMARILMN